MSTRDLYIIAGEPSGDRLGGALMTAMARESDVHFHGIGGQTMAEAGLRSLFAMDELTVMGLTEVLPRLPTILRRIRETADDVVARRPAALITIDSPDFTLRVAAKARKALPDLKVIHYVAPSVWTWRPGRAAKMARHVDHVLALLPFEPPYMEAAGMSCDFVGHPAVERTRPSNAEISAFRRIRGFEDRRVLLLAPGSRKGEIRRLMPDFVGAIRQLRRQDPRLAVVCPVAETVEAEVHSALQPVIPPVHTISPIAPAEVRRVAMAASDVALCASGTITLELAAVGTPMVAAYRTAWLTAQIVRRVVKVRTANLVNLVSGGDAVPEFLQEYCAPESLVSALSPLLYDPVAAARQREVFDEVMAALGRGGPAPSERAAQSVLTFLDRKAK